MSEWQPIETAPRDGTRILLCRVSLTTRELSKAVVIGHFLGLRPYARNWSVESSQYLREESLGGWMPLPSPIYS